MEKLIRITTVPISIEKLLENQPKYFSKFFDITIVSSDKSELEKLGKKQGVKTFCLPLTRKITPFKDIIAIFKLYFFLKRENPKIVHSHTPKAGFVGMTASFFAGVPIRMHTVAGLPLMERKFIKKKVLIFIEKLTYLFATNVYSNSKKLMEFILSKKFCSKRKIKTLANGSSNGIDTKYFSDNISLISKNKLLDTLKILKNDFVFCYVGRVVKDKGINELVSAFNELNLKNKNCKLIIVGKIENETNPVSKSTMGIIKKNKNILLTGFKNDVRPYLSIGNCFVFPSYREGFPNVLMQAGAMDLPCIATNINGCNEIIQDNINGFLIPPKNIDALVKAMQKIMDKKLIIKLSKNSRLMVKEKYDQKYFWKKLLIEYNNLVKCTL
ncbi:MAG: glycosyltransferase family 4 protein [Bacteroidota bacterium]|nr:glycosyltransferase family 4 protein [Bacteroidota bacterium]|tara:strand:+ start:674 stop:1825 length:1152 start_codon:yes stop_codon:yes gene_type:complete